MAQETKIDMSNQQQDSSNVREAPENEERKSVPIAAILEMVAIRLGVLVCGWAVAVLVQGGMVSMIESKDRMFVTIMFLLVCFRYWRYFCPQATGSLTEASRSLSANNILEQWVLPIHFIGRLVYLFQLSSAITSVVLSIMRLASHDFGTTEKANKATRDFALNVFYVVALAEALMLLLALTFDTIMFVVVLLPIVVRFLLNPTKQE